MGLSDDERAQVIGKLLKWLEKERADAAENFRAKDVSLTRRVQRVFAERTHVHDAATTPRQVFVTGDGWFTYNLLMNVANL